jgi:hypothetical protein
MIISFTCSARYLFSSLKSFEEFKSFKGCRTSMIDSKIVVEGKSKGLLAEQTIRDSPPNQVDIALSRRLVST